MSDKKQRIEIIETRNHHSVGFADWLVKSGLSPLDYEFVEETRGDGATIWYFQKRIKDDSMNDSSENGFVS